MNPAKSADANITKVGKMNFGTHIGWVVAIYLVSSSVLEFLNGTFDDAIHRERNIINRTIEDAIDRERPRISVVTMRVLRSLLLIWMLFSVRMSHESTVWRLIDVHRFFPSFFKAGYMSPITGNYLRTNFIGLEFG